MASVRRGPIGMRMDVAESNPYEISQMLASSTLEKQKKADTHAAIYFFNDNSIVKLCKNQCVLNNKEKLEKETIEWSTFKKNRKKVSIALRYLNVLMRVVTNKNSGSFVFCLCAN